MFFRRRRNRDDDEDWDSLTGFYDPDEDSPVRRKGPTLLLLTLVLLLVAAVGVGSYWLVQRTGPLHAAEEWFLAIWKRDGKTIMDRTCDEERWAPDLVNGGRLIGGFVEFFQISLPNDLPIPSLEGLKVTADRSQLKFELVEETEDRAVVTVNGRLQFQSLGAWTFVRFNETWTIVKEDDTWRWCGRQLVP